MYIVNCIGTSLRTLASSTSRPHSTRPVMVEELNITRYDVFLSVAQSFISNGFSTSLCPCANNCIQALTFFTTAFFRSKKKWKAMMLCSPSRSLYLALLSHYPLFKAFQLYLV